MIHVAFTLALFPSVVGVAVAFGLWEIGNPLAPNFDPSSVTFMVSFDFVTQVCILANSFQNCIIYTVRSPRFKVGLVIMSHNL